jgi:uncharacterized membrane protein YphA (DoxX/SURF4 family)
MRETIQSILSSRIVHFAARLILGAVFVYAGLAKISAPREFARIVVNYQVLPEKMAVYLAFILPWIEALLGILLILGFELKKTALALSFLLVVFVGAVLIRSANGSAAPCGCFSFKSSGPDSIFLTIGRDMALLACGAYLIIFHGKRASQRTTTS